MKSDNNKTHDDIGKLSYALRQVLVNHSGQH